MSEACSLTEGAGHVGVVPHNVAVQGMGGDIGVAAVVGGLGEDGRHDGCEGGDGLHLENWQRKCRMRSLECGRGYDAKG